VYVLDAGNRRIQKFRLDGAFVATWGSQGFGPGKLSASSGIAVSTDGFVYVLGTSISRVQKFRADGTFVATWGSKGEGPGQFSYASGIAVGTDGFVYVTDFNAHRVQKFRADGAFVATWGSKGTGPGQFANPSDIAVGTDGFVYVADTGNNRVQKFRSDGAFVTMWDDKELTPYGIAVDSRGKVYVTDRVKNNVQVYLPGIAWGTRVPVEFRTKVVQIADRLQVDPNHLMAAMAFETAETFSPSIPNQAGSGAVGLIQFTTPAAQCLRTTTAALGKMTALQQLDYVERYFKECAGSRKPATLEDLYMAILWPRAVGEPDDYILWQAPDIRYNQNRGLDRNGDGTVTKREAASLVKEKLEKGLGRDYFD
jgi:hypothetical protein